MTAPTPLAYFHGDDDLAIERAVADLVARLAEAGEPFERWNVRASRLAAAEQLAELRGRIATPVLFGGGTLAVVTNPGALMTTTQGRDAMLELVSLASGGNGLVVIEEARSGAKAPGQPKLAEAIRATGGAVKLFESPKEGGFAAWVEAEARGRGMHLQPGTAKAIATRVGGFVREGDAERRDQTRRAAMELDKLDLYRPSAPISVEDVEALVAEAVPGSAWALADAVGDRDGPRALELLDSLAETMPEPVIVVVLHRRIREMAELQDRLPGARNLAEAGKPMGILSAFRVQRLAEQAQRWRPAELAEAIDGLVELDAVVKGAPGRGGGEARHRVAFALWIADHVGRSGTRRPPRSGVRQPVRTG
jgi:DNA polymerase III delta subunit